jgi:hypothetical protein
MTNETGIVSPSAAGAWGDDLIAVILKWGHNCTRFVFDDVGSLQSVQDHMDKASLTFEPHSAQWDQTVQRCINGLCEAGIIECDD